MPLTAMQKLSGFVKSATSLRKAPTSKDNAQEAGQSADSNLFVKKKQVGFHDN